MHFVATSDAKEAIMGQDGFPFISLDLPKKLILMIGIGSCSIPNVFRKAILITMYTVIFLVQSREEGNDQESRQSSTTPDP